MGNEKRPVPWLWFAAGALFAAGVAAVWVLGARRDAIHASRPPVIIRGGSLAFENHCKKLNLAPGSDDTFTLDGAAPDYVLLAGFSPTLPSARFTNVKRIVLTLPNNKTATIEFSNGATIKVPDKMKLKKKNDRKYEYKDGVFPILGLSIEHGGGLSSWSDANGLDFELDAEGVCD